jgi:iron(III) transport system ATP-binding protein
MLVSHDALDTLSWADEIVVMKAGKIIQHAAPETIYYNPIDEYTAALFGRYNRFSLRAAIAVGINANSAQNQFIRPAQLAIARSRANGLKATINSVLFYGNYYEIEAVSEEEIFYVRTTQNGLEKGQTVTILLAKNHVT